MYPKVLLFLRITLLPLFAAGFYMQGSMLSAPHYIGGMGGFGAMFAFIFLVVGTLVGGVLFWLYTRLFPFDNGKAKPDFLVHFMAYLIPLCYNYINKPPVEAIWHDGRDDYFVNGEGIFCVVIMLGVMLFLFRLDTMKAIGKQVFVGLFSAFATFYGIMKFYCIYFQDKVWGYSGSLVTAPELSKQAYEFFLSLHKLLPEPLQEVQYLLKMVSARGYFAEDQVVIFLIALLLVPLVALCVHSICYILLCHENSRKPDPALRRAWVELFNALALYTIVMLVVLFWAGMLGGTMVWVVLCVSPFVFIYWKIDLLKKTVFNAPTGEDLA